MKGIFWFVLALYAPLAMAASSFTFDVQRGPRPVGFRLVNQYDESRKFQLPPPGPMTGWPIQTFIWYPASASDRPVRYREYLELVVAQIDFNQTAEAKQANIKIVTDSSPLKGEALEFELSRAQWATRDASALKGKFPVVIYAPSYGAGGFENADLCELLASHGYIVIAAHASGKDGTAMTMDRAGADSQAADIRFLMKYAEKVPGADVSKTAIIGYSWGGIANVFAAVDNPMRAPLFFWTGQFATSRWVMKSG